MDKELKDPVVVDGVAYYTLTSYDPVSVVVPMTTVGEMSVDSAVSAMVTNACGSLDRLFDNDWIHEKFPEAHNFQELKDNTRRKLNESNKEYMEQQKALACGDALAERLEQHVLRNDIDIVRYKLQQTFYDGLQQNNVTAAEYMKQSGMSYADLEKWFDEKAATLAKQQAALSAFAKHRNIVATDDEMVDILNIPKDQADEIIRELKARKRLDVTRESATISKARRVLLDESDCTFDYSNDDGIPGFLSPIPQLSIF